PIRGVAGAARTQRTTFTTPRRHPMPDPLLATAAVYAIGVDIGAAWHVRRAKRFNGYDRPLPALARAIALWPLAWAGTAVYLTRSAWGWLTYRPPTDTRHGDKP